jgi:peptide/nickel transport system permease protein
MKRLALTIVLTCVVVAALADFLASGRPLLLRWQGDTYWLSNVRDVPELEGLSRSDLRARMTDEDWAIWAPIPWSPHDVRTDGAVRTLEPPSAQHWLGTDDRGRDVLSRLVHGARATLVVAGLATFFSLLFGLALALASLTMRRPGWLLAGVDLASVMPALLVVVAIQGLLGGGSLVGIALIISIPRLADVARLAHAAMEEARALPYAAAAVAVGASRGRLLWRHLLPAAVPTMLVSCAITASTAALAEAALSFMGFGVSPPTASWGELLSQAAHNDLRWWLVLPSGAVLMIVASAFAGLAQRSSEVT